MNSFEKFKKQLPSKENCYSSLICRNIIDKEYEHVLTIWDRYEIKTMKSYHNLYMKCDFLLLADVLEKFRSISLKSYEL